jgi:hypothetical protein
MNCIKNQDVNDFEMIKNSFYIAGYKNGIEIYILTVKLNHQ